MNLFKKLFHVHKPYVISEENLRYKVPYNRIKIIGCRGCDRKVTEYI